MRISACPSEKAGPGSQRPPTHSASAFVASGDQLQGWSPPIVPKLQRTDYGKREAIGP
jgi:hypothetical protein